MSTVLWHLMSCLVICEGFEVEVFLRSLFLITWESSDHRRSARVHEVIDVAHIRNPLSNERKAPVCCKENAREGQNFIKNEKKNSTIRRGSHADQKLPSAPLSSSSDTTDRTAYELRRADTHIRSQTHSSSVCLYEARRVECIIALSGFHCVLAKKKFLLLLFWVVRISLLSSRASLSYAWPPGIVIQKAPRPQHKSDDSDEIAAGQLHLGGPRCIFPALTGRLDRASVGGGGG